MLDILNRQHTTAGKKVNPRKPIKWILVDSAIIGGIAMCAAMPPAIPGINELWVMGKAFSAAFFLQLAIERGIKRQSSH